MAGSLSSKSAVRENVPATVRPPKRLVFDRRYGWIVDEWRDPSEEALAGGRGMFCILPIAKALVKVASQSVDFAAQSFAKAMENPNQFTPQAIKENINDQFQKLCSMRRPNLSLFSSD